MFMPVASATAALLNDPDPIADPAIDGTPTQPRADQTPTQPRADRAPTQPHASRVLNLLRKLIEYGQDLARTVQGRATAATLFTVAVHFGTRDMALILARITRGLRLASALEARLVSRPVRPDADAVPVRAPADRAIHAPPDRAKRKHRRAAKRPELPDLPTAEEIAAALRHRPAAAVIADICRDLGIVPAHPLWGEVMAVLCGHGGNVMKFFKEAMARLLGSLGAAAAMDAVRWPAPPSHAAAPGGTGPPWPTLT